MENLDLVLKGYAATVRLNIIREYLLANEYVDKKDLLCIVGVTTEELANEK